MTELRAGFEICVRYRDEMVDNEWIDRCLRLRSLFESSKCYPYLLPEYGYGMSTVV